METPTMMMVMMMTVVFSVHTNEIGRQIVQPLGMEFMCLCVCKRKCCVCFRVVECNRRMATNNSEALSFNQKRHVRMVKAKYRFRLTFDLQLFVNKEHTILWRSGLRFGEKVIRFRVWRNHAMPEWRKLFKWLQNASKRMGSHRFFFFSHFSNLQKDLFLGKADPGIGAPSTTTTTNTTNSVAAAASGAASTTGQGGGQGSPPRSERERKLSVSSTSMKTKWLKAFRSLKPATAIASTVKWAPRHTNPPAHTCRKPVIQLHLLHLLSRFRSRRKSDQSNNGRRAFDGENHNLQEYTYKKITPCDVCSQVLRGKQQRNGHSLPSNRLIKNEIETNLKLISFVCVCVRVVEWTFFEFSLHADDNRAIHGFWTTIEHARRANKSNTMTDLPLEKTTHWNCL